MKGIINVPGTNRKDFETVYETAKGAAESVAAMEETVAALQQTQFIIQSVPYQAGILTYTGSEQAPNWNSYDSAKLVVSGTTKATVAGTYSTTFTPADGYQWYDETTDAKTISWTIGRAGVDLPTQSGTLTYTGSAQSPSWSDYNSTQLAIGGTTSSTNAGAYTATFTPTSNYQWRDGTTSAKTVTWTIGKAAGSLSLSATTMACKSASDQTFTATRAGDGQVSATSSNTDVATVSVSGTTVTVTPKGDGATTITVSVAEGTNHMAPGSKTCSVTVWLPKVYGVQWDGTSTTAWTRTDDSANFTDPVPYVKGASSYGSPFDNLQPWAGMERVTDSVAGELVKIPKFWYKWTKSGNTLKLQIADTARTGFYVSPAHADRGDDKGERDVVYVGRYHCGETAYKSASGQLPKVAMNRATARINIANLGTGIYQFDMAMRATIWMLYLVEFADWNSQEKIGWGCGNESSTQSLGATDSMPYHTGTMQTYRNTYAVGVQYRYIEGLWDNCMDWLDGCYYGSSGLYIVKNPANFSDYSNGTLVGKPTAGWPSAMAVSTVSGLEWVIYPSVSNGSRTTYITDSWYSSTSNPCLYSGGGYNQTLDWGMFCSSYASSGDTLISCGCRLQKLP